MNQSVHRGRVPKLTVEQLYQITSAMVHLLVGAMLVVLAAYLAPGNAEALFVLLGILLAFEVVKEYVVDVRVEEGETYLSGTADLLTYFAASGVAAAAIVFAAHRPL